MGDETLDLVSFFAPVLPLNELVDFACHLMRRVRHRVSLDMRQCLLAKAGLVIHRTAFICPRCGSGRLRERVQSNGSDGLAIPGVVSTRRERSVPEGSAARYDLQLAPDLLQAKRKVRELVDGDLQLSRQAIVALAQLQEVLSGADLADRHGRHTGHLLAIEPNLCPRRIALDVQAATGSDCRGAAWLGLTFDLSNSLFKGANQTVSSAIRLRRS